MECSYKKGKDIKVPFDCLWHCMTRSFEVRCINKTNRQICVYDNEIWSFSMPDTAEEFEKW